MRRILFAFLAVMLLVPAGLLEAQSQGTASEAAIAAVRTALAARPSDETLKRELFELLAVKQRDLRQQLSDLEREMAMLRPERMEWSTAGCGEPVPTGPMRVGGAVTPPRKTIDVPPVYPPVAQASRIQGIVILEAAIDCTGMVWNARVLRGQPLLNEAAIEAVRQWRYEPALLEGKPVPVIMTVTVTFALR